jgi:hypothetical protein
VDDSRVEITTNYHTHALLRLNISCTILSGLLRVRECIVFKTGVCDVCNSTEW